eukprot:TRINITY_DN32658_c0_g2_i1.p1 TRINITY_DN32658_c0_g2~~TRINITY_DN32658_c0_g2_i1.p1  ORF type:complete len:701 (-),score=135.94 TRINITY_DN32658_c0_g2_i1:162-2264(-)
MAGAAIHEDGTAAAATAAEKKDLRASSPTQAGAEEQCPVCWGLLCEPVAWPACSHRYCMVCSLRTRQRPRPSCPLCRLPASRVRRSSELQVDSAHAAAVRKIVGFSKYEAQRREIWSDVATLDTDGSLGELPLCSVGGPWRFRSGSRHQLRLFEPRYQQMISRAMAPGGGRRFAMILQPAKFQEGAKGRVCEIVEGVHEEDGDWRIIVEGGVPCRVLCVDSEEVSGGQGAAPLFRGRLEEIAEDEMESELPAAGNGELEGGSFTPLAAASEMIDILGTLARHLREMRRRRMLMAAGDTSAALDAEGGAWQLGAGGEAVEDGDPTPRQPNWPEGGLGAASPPGPAGLPPGDPEQQGYQAMLGMLLSYRQIIGQMDSLLAEASTTVARLGSEDAGPMPSQSPPVQPGSAAAAVLPPGAALLPMMPPEAPSIGDPIRPTLMVPTSVTVATYMSPGMAIARPPQTAPPSQTHTPRESAGPPERPRSLARTVLRRLHLTGGGGAGSPGVDATREEAAPAGALGQEGPALADGSIAMWDNGMPLQQPLVHPPLSPAAEAAASPMEQFASTRRRIQSQLPPGPMPPGVRRPSVMRHATATSSDRPPSRGLPPPTPPRASGGSDRPPSRGGMSAAAGQSRPPGAVIGSQLATPMGSMGSPGSQPSSGGSRHLLAQAARSTFRGTANTLAGGLRLSRFTGAGRRPNTGG